MGYFTTDTDANKRRKVVDWLLAAEAVRDYLAARLGVPADRVRISRLVDVKTGKANRVAVVWVENGDIVHTGGVKSLAVSPDGKAMAIQQAIDARVEALTFSPDGKTLHTAGRDGVVRVWDANTGKDITARVAPVADLAVGVKEADTGTVLLGSTVNSNAGLTGSVVLNERNFDLTVPARVSLNVTWPHEIQVVGRGAAVTDFDSDGVLDLLIVAQPPDPAFVPRAVIQPVESQPQKFKVTLIDVAAPVESDADFLKRVTQSARGSAPTALEEKYFAEDKDPKKREKLLDLLLKDPAVAKKVGDDWKKKMLAPPERATARFQHVPLRLYDNVPLRLDSSGSVEWYVPLPDKFDKLVGELLAAKKTDEQVLEAVTLAAVGRLPTAEEKRATLAVIGTAQDKKAAYVKLAKSLAAMDEGKK